MFFDVFDLKSFLELDFVMQVQYLWKRVFSILVDVSERLKDSMLREAIQYAYKKGLDIGLDPDFRILQQNIMIKNKSLDASLWARFNREVVIAEFALSIGDRVIFTNEVDQSRPDIEFFYEMFTRIEVDKKNRIIIKGARDVDIFPIRIIIPEEVLNAIE